MLAVLGAMLVVAVGALREEIAVAGSDDRIEQGHADLPARAALRRAQRALTEASRLSGDDQSTVIRAARRDLAAALRARPRWGECWVLIAYAAVLDRGPTSLSAQRAFQVSLNEAPFLAGSAEWRWRYAVSVWPLLDPDTRRRAMNEAVWYSRLRRANADMIVGIAGTSPAAAALQEAMSG